VPDWITHILSALIIAELLKVRKKSLLVLGVLLPDLLCKLYLLNVFTNIPIQLTTFMSTFHELVPAILASVLIAFFFYKNLMEAMILIPAGTLLHFLLDATTRHYFYTPWWAFFWADEYWILLFMFMIAYLGILLIKRFRNGNTGCNMHAQ